MRKIKKKCLKLFNKREYKNPQIIEDTENMITFKMESIYFPEEIIKYHINIKDKTIQKVSKITCICQNCVYVNETDVPLDETEKLDKYFIKNFNQIFVD